MAPRPNGAHNGCPAPSSISSTTQGWPTTSGPGFHLLRITAGGTARHHTTWKPGLIVENLFSHQQELERGGGVTVGAERYDASVPLQLSELRLHLPHSTATLTLLGSGCVRLLTLGLLLKTPKWPARVAGGCADGLHGTACDTAAARGITACRASAPVGRRQAIGGTGFGRRICARRPGPTARTECQSIAGHRRPGRAVQSPVQPSTVLAEASGAIPGSS